MKSIKFRLTAYTDPAGKWNDDAPKRGNEDDLFVASTKGIDVGIATSFNGKEKNELPSNIKGRIVNIENQKLLMIAKTPSLTN